MDKFEGCRRPSGLARESRRTQAQQAVGGHNEMVAERQLLHNRRLRLIMRSPNLLSSCRAFTVEAPCPAASRKPVTVKNSPLRMPAPDNLMATCSFNEFSGEVGARLCLFSAVSADSNGQTAGSRHVTQALIPSELL
jgi:hypothetical protein